MMRHDSGKVLSSILKYLLKLLFVCLLLGILYYSFKDSMEDMITELSKVSPQVILVLFLSVILYHLCEGHITWLIVHKTHPEYPRLKGFCNAFYCSFYKTATLGSGSGIAGIYYLNKAGIPVPNATGMYFFQNRSYCHLKLLQNWQSIVCYCFWQPMDLFMLHLPIIRVISCWDLQESV